MSLESVRLENAMVLALKNLLFLLLVPGTVGVYLPLLLVRGEEPTAHLAARVASGLLIGAGAAGYVWCVWNFARLGRGTPAPIDAPKRLVVAGAHRWVRNPMYLSVLGAIAGWALLYESLELLGYLAAMALVFQSIVVLYEETVLKRQFGPEYERYCESVGRWRPRLLFKLGRLDKARSDLSRALMLMAPFGLAAEPWKAHHIRYEIESAAGAAVAMDARAEAIRLYTAYRDGGGAPQEDTGRLVEDLCKRVAAGTDPATLADHLPPADAFPEELHPFRATLEALLRAHPADPDDPRHDYCDVVELRRLQAALRERLGT